MIPAIGLASPGDRPPVARRVRGFVALLAGLLVGACLARPFDLRAAPPMAVPPDPWPDAGTVPVRLADAEGSVEVTFESDRGDAVRLRRQGPEVVRDGLSGADWLRVDLPRGAEVWRYRDREYPGSLLVEPAPGGGLRVTALIELEDYVEGVVASELVLWNASPALLEAQAIAARSYAVANLDARAAAGRAFLRDGVLDQAFRGRFRPDAASRSRGLDERLRAAVRRTRGEVLTFAGEVLDARFHAACGGRTARPEDVFANAPPAGHASVECPPCSDSRAALAEARARGLEAAPEDADLAWTWTASAAELAALASGLELGTRLRSLQPLRTDDGARWLEVALVGDRRRVQLPAGELRRELGWSRLRSALVTNTWPRPGTMLDGGLRFDGLGFGHGAGLCQRGAERLADGGQRSASILALYYPDARVERWDGARR